jgi:diaminopimelate epimerase
MSDRVKLITAAGGNGTAIEIIDQPLSRTAYEARGRMLGESLETAGAEQAGFLVLGSRHFEMAGGEFCGNATRAAAVLLSEAGGQERLSFTVSGFNGRVSAVVKRRSPGLYDARCEFPGLPTHVQAVALTNGLPASIVDLGGIVHVVIEDVFPKDPADYELAHARITARFGLGDRDAVGAIWCRREQGAVAINPVVWVRAVDTFFYETSCGSGTIAAGIVTGAASVIQPSGKPIQVEVANGFVALASEMEVAR